ncbi:uncharacterized protein LOC134792546 [Cydia splendana]|uniref:uncharacterized protein LOC134792546 n=1 Tax=Cydia splendana TaxID=1100963 RepID=UPI0021267C30
MTAKVRQRTAEKPKEKADKQNDQETEPTRRYWDPLTDGVRWIEKYSEPLEKFFERIPDFISTIIATFAVFTLGATLRGEWVVILVTALKQMTGTYTEDKNATVQDFFSLFTERNLKMENFGVIFLAAHTVSFSMYFLIGGFLHWYFYVRRRDRAQEWKIQPNKWLSPELERHEIMVGCLSLIVTGTFSAFLATYILNGNPSTVYYQYDEYGWWWFWLQIPVIFIINDYTTYIMHRLYHTPWLYKNFHKLHHKYKQPTAFSVTAIHPVEILHLQLTLCLPLFTFPVHWIPFYAVALYSFYHGIIDHSGIDFKAQWWQPWQPDASFHDQHHEFTHVNFAFNIQFWDRLHGTIRKPNRVYTEETYHGTAPLEGTEEAKAVLEAEAKEIEKENEGKSSLNAS